MIVACGADHSHRYHRAVKHEVGARAVDGQAVGSLDAECHLLGIILVVIGDIQLPHMAPLGVEVIAAGSEFKRDGLFAGIFASDVGKSLGETGRHVAPGVGPYAVRCHVYCHFGRCGCGG